MCPDRTPAVFRTLFEGIDPDQVKLPTEDVFVGLVEALGFLPKANIRVSVALCEDHMRSMAENPEVTLAVFQDAAREDREGRNTD
jgi:hypothetical protein